MPRFRLCAALCLLWGAALLTGCNNSPEPEASSGPKVIEHTEMKMPPGALDREMAQQRDRSLKAANGKKQ